MTRDPELLTDEEREALEQKIDEQSELLRETLTEDVDDDADEDAESAPKIMRESGGTR
jgi:hypothetical protein